MEGYIKLHRKILDNGLFADAELLKVFIWCILKANREPKVIYGRSVGKGQFITGRVSASEELHIKPSTVYKRMQSLKAQGYIDIDSNTKNSLITVCNWKSYQLENEVKKRNLDNVTNKFLIELAAFKDTYSKETLEAFYDYWTEPNRSKTKLRYELQKTFDISRRLKTWNKNEAAFKPKEKKNILDTWQEARNII
tara:strand:+ start:8419 stop:9003 length:585 start_codon:yes stop_codon:yes gene_type:complete